MGPTWVRVGWAVAAAFLLVSFPADRVCRGGEPGATYQIVDTEAAPGQEQVVMPVAAAFPTAAQGFSMVIAHECPTCRVVGGLTEDTTAQGADFVSVEEDHANQVVVVAVLMDMEPPFGGALISPSDEPRTVLHLLIDIAPETIKRHYRFYFVPEGIQWGNAWVYNTYAAMNESHRVTDLRPGDLIVSNKPQGGLPLFIRGDANQDLQLDVADAVAMLDVMYKPEVVARCMDACDANDDGWVDVGDPIYLLNYLFVDGPLPPDPLDEAGLDWTPDPLDCEEPEAGWLTDFWPD